MKESSELIQRLNLRGESLSKGHRRIAEYIAGHYDKAIFMTAVTLGKQCGVSESTVVRFAAALGYEGYPSCKQPCGSWSASALRRSSALPSLRKSTRMTSCAPC